MTLGEKIQEVLDWSGLHQKDLAEATGISPSMISSYIKGVHAVSLEAAQKIADALDVSLWVLLNGEALPVMTLDMTEKVSRNRIRVKERDGKSETGKGRESQSYQGKQRTSMRRPPRRGRALSSSTRTAARGSSGGFLYS